VSANNAPHVPQNFAVGLDALPHCGQICASLCPHSSQNLAPEGFSNWQFVQRISPPDCLCLPRSHYRRNPGGWQGGAAATDNFGQGWGGTALSNCVGSGPIRKPSKGWDKSVPNGTLQIKVDNSYQA
jgi:hypothetical protein